MAFKKERKPRGRPPHKNRNATARRASIDPVIRALIAWRRQRQLSQLAAAEYAQAHGFPLYGFLYPYVGRGLAQTEASHPGAFAAIS